MKVDQTHAAETVLRHVYNWKFMVQHVGESTVRVSYSVHMYASHVQVLHIGMVWYLSCNSSKLSALLLNILSIKIIAIAVEAVAITLHFNDQYH